VIKHFIAAALIATTAAAAGSAFASSGYGPAPHYDPSAGAPASQRGPSSQTIGIGHVDLRASSDAGAQSFGGMPDATSESGVRFTNDIRATFAHH
jgi:hypothetical protein